MLLEGQPHNDKAVIPTAPPTIDIIAILPVALVAITGILALIFEMIAPKRDNGAILAASVTGLLVAALVLVSQLGESVFETAGDMIVRDGFATGMQLVLVVAAILSILFSEPYLKQKRAAFGEFYPLILWATVGGMLMSSSQNLVVIFVGLEILSVALYVLAGMSRTEEKSEESALKYFLLGAFASGFLLYGISFFYGATGGLHLGQVNQAWQATEGPTRTLLLFGYALMLVGLGFKTSLVPFQQWTPDVYQGAPTNVTAFMATGAKIAAFAALYRVLDAATGMQSILIPALSVVAVLTMVYGNLVALAQKDVKRILAYSSISHAGYVLVAILAHLAAPKIVGYDTLLYYLLSYSLMTIGAFAVVSLLKRDGAESTNLDDLRGLAKRSPLAGGALLVCLWSLIGLPLTSGFWGKFLIFSNALSANLNGLAVILAINSIIGACYYLRILRSAFSDVPEGERGQSEAPRPVTQSALVICAAGVVAAFVFYAPLMNLLGKR